MSSIKVLLVEDDERLAQLTARYLESHGVLVTIAATGTEGQAEALRRQYDCIVLDVMLPGRDGIEVTRELRARTDVPIVMVTARTEEADRVLGLEVGADDYVTKPFSPRELLARIRATVRRVRGQAGPTQQTVQVGGLVLDPAEDDGDARRQPDRRHRLRVLDPARAGPAPGPRAVARAAARSRQGLGRAQLRPLDRRPRVAAARQARRRQPQPEDPEDRARRRLPARRLRDER